MLLNTTTYKYFLWSLKLGAIINIYFLLQTIETKIADVDPFLLIPAQILFFVSAYRCLFPVLISWATRLQSSHLFSCLPPKFLISMHLAAYPFVQKTKQTLKGALEKVL